MVELSLALDGGLVGKGCKGAPIETEEVDREDKTEEGDTHALTPPGSGLKGEWSGGRGEG